MLDDMHNPKIEVGNRNRAIINHTNSDIDKISLPQRYNVTIILSLKAPISSLVSKCNIALY